VIRFRSIITRIVVLHVVAIGVTSILMPLALYYLLDQAANNLHRDALRSQAFTISSFLRPQPDGSLALDIPPEVRPLYSGNYGLYAYAVLDTQGRALFSSRSDGGPLFTPDEQSLSDWFIRRRSSGAMLFGVSVPRPIGERMYFIQIGQDLAHRDVIIDDVVASFFPRVAWITFPILLLLLLIDILIVRRALDPVREASTTASAIGPQRTEVRLPEQSMPAEIAPLVHAVNQALDRLETGFRAQRDFTADMAHELRTPLNGIIGGVNLLLHEPATLSQTKYYEILQHSSDLMLSLINHILDFSKINEGKINLDRNVFNMNQMLSKICRVYEAQNLEGEVDFIFHLDQRLDKDFVSDDLRLHQILVNLLTNARKFTKKGSIVYFHKFTPCSSHSTRLCRVVFATHSSF